MPKAPSAGQVVERACQAAFGNPLVTNVLRGQLVEAMIALVLEPEWSWCGSDYASWDFERHDGVRLEVKQSSYRQTWAAPDHGKIFPSFDIRERTGRWEGAAFIDEPGRAAHLYIFAYHGTADDTADHRDPGQWRFFVVPTSALPTTRRLSLRAATRLTDPVGIAELAETVRVIATTTKPAPQP